MKRLLIIFAVIASFVFSHVTVAKSFQTTGVVNINSASQEQLVMVPGIGEGKAKAILEMRVQSSFNKKEDLLAVKGIGEKMLQKISPYVVVSGKTTIKREKMSQ